MELQREFLTLSAGTVWGVSMNQFSLGLCKEIHWFQGLFYFGLESEVQWNSSPTPTLANLELWAKKILTPSYPGWIGNGQEFCWISIACFQDKRLPKVHMRLDAFPLINTDAWTNTNTWKLQKYRFVKLHQLFHLSILHFLFVCVFHFSKDFTFTAQCNLCP